MKIQESGARQGKELPRRWGRAVSLSEQARGGIRGQRQKKEVLAYKSPGRWAGMHMNQNTSKDLLGTQGKTFEKALVEKQVFTPKSSYFQMR